MQSNLQLISNLLDSQISKEYKESGLWIMQVKHKSLSTEEVVEIGTKGGIIYTIMPGSLT